MWHGRRPDRTVTGDLIETFRCFGRDGEPVVIRFVAGPAVLARPSLGREVEEAARAIVEIGRSPSVTVHIDGGPSVVYPPAS